MANDKVALRSRCSLTAGVARAANEIEAAMHVRLPGDALERLVRSDANLRRGLRGCRHTQEGSRGLDTYERDILFDAVARYVGASHWPCNGERPEAMDSLRDRVAEAVRDGRLVRVEPPPESRRTAKGRRPAAAA